MLNAWGDHPAVHQAVQEASEALGEDLAALISQGPKEMLALTTNTQPVMLLAGVAAYRVWTAETGLAPAAVAGHSLGEYSALVAAGVLTLSEAAPLVRFRAQAMQDAVPVGAGGQRAGHLFLTDLGADRDDLPLLDVCSKADHQVGEALKGLLVKAAE